MVVVSGDGALAIQPPKKLQESRVEVHEVCEPRLHTEAFTRALGHPQYWPGTSGKEVLVDASQSNNKGRPSVPAFKTQYESQRHNQ